MRVRYLFPSTPSVEYCSAYAALEVPYKIYVVLMNEDARPFMKAELADGTFAWGHSPLHVKGYIYSNTSSAFTVFCMEGCRCL